jgi:hypothetical protein
MIGFKTCYNQATFRSGRINGVSMTSEPQKKNEIHIDGNGKRKVYNVKVLIVIGKGRAI